MKFTKLLLPLVAMVPFATTSCSNKMTMEEAKKWVVEHYKADQGKAAYATFAWDYHLTTGSKTQLEDIFGTIPPEGEDPDVSMNIRKDFYSFVTVGSDSQYNAESDPIKVAIGKIVSFPGINIPTGERKVIDSLAIITMPALSGLNFDSFFGDFNKKTTTFKVSNDELTVNYSFETSIPNPLTEEEDYYQASCVRVYNSKGYCRDYGFKIGRAYINSKNIVKVKATINFTFTDK